jgi:hypothetical protein
MYFWRLQKGSNNKESSEFLFLKKCSVYIFRAALYLLISVLDKDVLFHSQQCHYIQHNNTQYSDTEQNDTEHKDIQDNTQ